MLLIDEKDIAVKKKKKKKKKEKKSMIKSEKENKNKVKLKSSIEMTKVRLKPSFFEFSKTNYKIQ